MKKNTAFGFSLFLLFLFLLTSRSYAKVILQPDFEGTVLITSSSGEITLIEPGQPIPEIPSGSTIEVFRGHLTVAADGPDTIKVACLGHQGIASGGGASVGLSCGENSGAFKMLKGSGSAIDPSGKEQALEEGKEYPIKVSSAGETQGQGEAPATAAGEPTGGPPAGGGLGEAPPIDSRSIESSPSQ